MAVTSRETRGRLEDAFAASAGLVAPTSLRAYLRAQEQAARAVINGGSVKSASGDGKSVAFADYGPGQITQTELVDLYRHLVDDFDCAFMWLTNCANSGLDAFVTEFSLFPNSTTPTVPALVIDSTGRWLQLCVQFAITPAKVIGAAVNDISVFLWMMFHEVGAIEARSDYGQMRVAEGAQFT